MAPIRVNVYGSSKEDIAKLLEGNGIEYTALPPRPGIQAGPDINFLIKISDSAAIAGAFLIALSRVIHSYIAARVTRIVNINFEDGKILSINTQNIATPEVSDLVKTLSGVKIDSIYMADTKKISTSDDNN